ncbi:MAG: hypothetical protein ACTSWQ_01220 [Candidatus Thorarchaeota archaeon]
MSKLKTYLDNIKNTFSKVHKTIVAPDVLEDDPWFGPAINSTLSADSQEEALDTPKEIAYTKEVKATEETNPVHPNEPENIHQQMYEIATESWTTVQETQGGSENFQEGPNGWNSGIGLNS